MRNTVDMTSVFVLAAIAGGATSPREVDLIGSWVGQGTFAVAPGVCEERSALLRTVSEGLAVQLELRPDRTFRMVYGFEFEGRWSLRGSELVLVTQRAMGRSLNVKHGAAVTRLRFGGEGVFTESCPGPDGVLTVRYRRTG